MKCEMIQKNILAAAMRMKGGHEYKFGPMEDKIAVITGYSLLLLPKDKFVLSLSRLNKLGFKTDVNPRTFLDTENFYKQAKLTPELKIVEKKTYQKIKAIEESGPETWVETKLLKPFDSPTFEILKDKRSPIHVYEEGEIAGLVLPHLMRD